MVFLLSPIGCIEEDNSARDHTKVHPGKREQGAFSELERNAIHSKSQNQRFQFYIRCFLQKTLHAGAEITAKCNKQPKPHDPGVIENAGFCVRNPSWLIGLSKSFVSILKLVAGGPIACQWMFSDPLPGQSYSNQPVPGRVIRR